MSDPTDGTPAPDPRGRWRSKLGFVLAASGSAIGLGNVVFFGSNAYTYGFGAFYLPYLIALFVIGMPVLIAELGLGSLTQQAFPAAMRRIGGKWGEVAGWWALLNASFITMYYITIIAWVCGMFLGAAGPLWQAETATPGYDAAAMPNPGGFFFHLISSPWVLALVAVVWALNVWIVRRGTTTIEPVVKVFVPLMWLFMIALIVRGLTLPHGEEGVFLLFTPDFQIASDPAVWQGAVSQIFFSLTLGFGVMTAYASYLPRDADQVNNGVLTACLNCGFEYIAGLAIFSLLFAFAIVPSAGTLSMIFFVVPEGIAALPAGVKAFGLVFFLLLLMAGLTSSVSLIEGLNCALIDKFGWSRKRTLLAASAIGLAGSLLFALPVVIDPALANTGTLGFTLIALIDNWAFNHGLLLVGLVECLMLGWLLPVARLREELNRHSRIKIPVVFDWLIKLVIPAALIFVLGASVWSQVTSTGLFGWNPDLTGGRVLPVAALAVWLAWTFGASAVLATARGRGAAFTTAPGGLPAGVARTELTDG
jgi:NSS family neurotransmitter:Na+ symporter